MVNHLHISETCGFLLAASMLRCMQLALPLLQYDIELEKLTCRDDLVGFAVSMCAQDQVTAEIPQNLILSAPLCRNDANSFAFKTRNAHSGFGAYASDKGWHLSRCSSRAS